MKELGGLQRSKSRSMGFDPPYIIRKGIRYSEILDPLANGYHPKVIAISPISRTEDSNVQTSASHELEYDILVICCLRALPTGNV